jgi:hypothetical protein
MAVALIALFVSLGGVSYGFATGSVDTRELKNNDVRSRDLRNNDVRTLDVRNNEVRGRDIRNSTIRSADVALNTLTGIDIDESKLGRVPSAASAATAVSATRGLSPVAFARIDSTGNVVEADSRGVADANVDREGPAFYCFRGLSFAFRTAQVTVDYGDPATGGQDDLMATLAKDDPQADCTGTATQLKVVTADVESPGAGLTASGFFVWFFD